jgi:hypothetical protein
VLIFLKKRGVFVLTIEQIFAEVDTLVPNFFDAAKKVTWINEINKEFFEVVKIPLVHQFVTEGGISSYDLPSTARSNNVIRVQVGSTLYNSMQYEDVRPGHNFWVVDDATQKMQLNPKPSLTGQVGVVNYHKISTKTFLTSTISADKPDAPEEYHWSYVLGLCERVAKAMNDVTLANNFGNDYRSQLSLAQQNYGTRLKGE